MARRPIVILSPPPPDERASPLLRALVEAIVPEGSPDDEIEQQHAVDAAADFLAGELAELPLRLRLMFLTGISGFRVITAIVHGRTFCRLPLAKRRAWIEHWAWGPIGLTRQLFRPVRSIALLAYYETLAESRPSLAVPRAA